MNPITFEMLARVERQQNEERIKVYQRRNQSAEKAGPSLRYSGNLIIRIARTIQLKRKCARTIEIGRLPEAAKD
jgi:hypothetical protein